MNIVHKALTASVLALSVSTAFAAGSPGVEQHTQAFLEALEKGVASRWNSSHQTTPARY